MMQMRLRITLAMIAALAGCSRGYADFHVQAGVAGLGRLDTFNDIEPTGTYRDYWNQGDAFASAHGSYASTSAYASISLVESPGIRLFATASSGPQSAFVSYAAAQWLDTVRVSPDVEHSPLKFTMKVTGKASVDGPGPLGYAYASSGLTFDSLGTGLYPPSGIETFIEGAVSDSSIIAADSGPQDEFSYFQVSPRAHDVVRSGSSVSWTAEFLVPYRAEVGGYVWNLWAGLEARASIGGSATSDFSSTYELVSVTRADGGAVEGGVTFDSGFLLPNAVVPEPSSLALGMLAALTLAGASLRRRGA